MMIQIQIRPWKPVATLTSTAPQGELTLRKTPRLTAPRGKAAQCPCPQRNHADKGHRSVRTTFPYANKKGAEVHLNAIPVKSAPFTVIMGVTLIPVRVSLQQKHNFRSSLGGQQRARQRRGADRRKEQIPKKEPIHVQYHYAANHKLQ